MQRFPFSTLVQSRLWVFPARPPQPQRQLLSRSPGPDTQWKRERARLFNLLYTKGLTTQQIGEISDSIYGRAYSKQQVSHLSRSCREDVELWLGRALSPHYLAVYIDATFISTRRDVQVCKEAYYTMLGVLEDGSREVLTIVNHPTEGAVCWKEELEALKERGVERIDLIVSDALQGIENAVCAAFPQAAHLFCVAHVKRQILSSVSHKDKPAVAQELGEVFSLENKEMKSLQGYGHFITFVTKWEKKYPTLRRYKAERNAAYFTYMDFPIEVQRCIYTTQLDWKAKQKIQENRKHEDLYAVRQGSDIPIGCCGYGGNKEDICQKNISI